MQTPKSEAVLNVSQSVYHFEDEMTRDRSPIARVKIVWHVSAYRRCLLNLQSFSLFNFGKIFRRKLVLIVQYKLFPFQNCSVVLFMIGFLSFILKINGTFLPYLFFVISFRCCWVEFPRRYQYRSCLLTQANISRLGLCLMRIALKLTRFRELHHVSYKYLQSISQALISQYLSAWTIGCGLHLKLKELLYS